MNQPETPLTFRRAGRPGEVVLHVTGEIDGATADALDRELTAVLESRPGRLLVETSAVSFCDSRGVSVLLAAWRRAGENEVHFSLHRPSARLRRILSLTGIDTLITIS